MKLVARVLSATVSKEVSGKGFHYTLRFTVYDKDSSVGQKIGEFSADTADKDEAAKFEVGKEYPIGN